MQSKNHNSAENHAEKAKEKDTGVRISKDDANAVGIELNFDSEEDSSKSLDDQAGTAIAVDSPKPENSGDPEKTVSNQDSNTHTKTAETLEVTVDTHKKEPELSRLQEEELVEININPTAKTNGEPGNSPSKVKGHSGTDDNSDSVPDINRDKLEDQVVVKRKIRAAEIFAKNSSTEIVPHEEMLDLREQSESPVKPRSEAQKFPSEQEQQKNETNASKKMELSVEEPVRIDVPDQARSTVVHIKIRRFKNFRDFRLPCGRSEFILIGACIIIGALVGSFAFDWHKLLPGHCKA